MRRCCRLSSTTDVERQQLSAKKARMFEHFKSAWQAIPRVNLKLSESGIEWFCHLCARVRSTSEATSPPSLRRNNGSSLRNSRNWNLPSFKGYSTLYIVADPFSNSENVNIPNYNLAHTAKPELCLQETFISTDFPQVAPRGRRRPGPP